MALDRDSDDTRDTDKPADDTRTPAMGGKGRRQAASATHDDDAHDDADDVAARIKAATTKANREAKEYRLRAKELEDRLAEIEAAQQEAEAATLPEIEKLQRQIAKRDEEHAETATALETIADAYDALQREYAVFKAGLGKVNPTRLDAVMRLLDHDMIETDEDTGELRGVDKAIDAVLKEYPEFAAAQRGPGTPPPSRDQGGAGTPPRRPVGGGSGAANPVDRAAQQLIDSGKYHSV
jgi:hypothetical protein